MIITVEPTFFTCKLLVS